MAGTRSTVLWTLVFVLLVFLVGVPTCVHFTYKRHERIHAGITLQGHASQLVIPISDRVLPNTEAPGIVHDAIAAELAHSTEYKIGDGPGCLVFCPDGKTWTTSEVICVSAEPYAINGYTLPVHVAVNVGPAPYFLPPADLPEWFNRGVKVSFTTPKW